MIAICFCNFWQNGGLFESFPSSLIFCLLIYQVLMCPEHEMEKVNMYCEVCRRPVCHLCKLGGSHANHKVTSMSNAYKILKVPQPHRAPQRRRGVQLTSVLTKQKLTRDTDIAS